MRNRKAMTLIEMMLAVSLGAMVIMVTSGFFQKLTQTVKETREHQALTTEQKVVNNMIQATLPRALPMSVVVCSCGPASCSTSCAIPTGGAPFSRIEFATGDTNEHVAIYQDGTNLMFQERGGEPQVLSAHALGLSFTSSQNDSYILHYTVALGETDPNGLLVQSFAPTQTVHFRDWMMVASVLSSPPPSPHSCFLQTTSFCTQTGITPGSPPYITCGASGSPITAYVASCTSSGGGCSAIFVGPATDNYMCGPAQTISCTSVTSPSCP